MQEAIDPNDDLVLMLAARKEADAANAAMVDRVERELTVRMDNGVNINPIFRNAAAIRSNPDLSDKAKKNMALKAAKDAVKEKTAAKAAREKQDAAQEKQDAEQSVLALQVQQAKAQEKTKVRKKLSNNIEQ